MELYRQVALYDMMALYDIVSFSPTTCKPYVVEESSSDAYRLELRAASGQKVTLRVWLKWHNDTLDIEAVCVPFDDTQKVRLSSKGTMEQLRTAGRQAILKALTNYVKLIDDDKRNASIKELADIVSDQ